MKYIALLVSVLLVGVDQLTKWLVVNNMEMHEKIRIITIGDFELLNFLRITPNSGAAFGILQGKQPFLITVTSVFLLGVIIYMLSNKPKSKLLMWSWSLVIAGGIGNLIDRVLYGEVTDFIEAFFMRNTIFNFADICAVVGAIMLILTVIRDDIIIRNNKKIPTEIETIVTEEENASSENNE